MGRACGSGDQSWRERRIRRSQGVTAGSEFSHQNARVRGHRSIQAARKGGRRRRDVAPSDGSRHLERGLAAMRRVQTQGYEWKLPTYNQSSRRGDSTELAGLRSDQRVSGSFASTGEVWICIATVSFTIYAHDVAGCLPNTCNVPSNVGKRRRPGRCRPR